MSFDVKLEGHREAMQWLQEFLTYTLQQFSEVECVHLVAGRRPFLRVKKGGDLVEIVDASVVTQEFLEAFTSNVLDRQSLNNLEQTGEVEFVIKDVQSISDNLWICGIYLSLGDFRVVLRKFKELSTFTGQNF